MPQIVAELGHPALFWLDGHYSGGGTAKGKQETPISLELRAVLDAPASVRVFLIDDVRFLMAAMINRIWMNCCGMSATMAVMPSKCRLILPA